MAIKHKGRSRSVCFLNAQFTCCDLTRGSHPCLWLITWDPTQPTATRPLAIQKDGTWYCYGWDLTKNVCEVFGQAGYIRTTYSYTPYGSAMAEGDVTQPLQWSSEYADPELGLIYYNYRYYNPTDGRWLRRDPLGRESGINEYKIVAGNPLLGYDFLGLLYSECILLERKATKHGSKVNRKSFFARFIDSYVPFLITNERYVIQRYCKYRCYYKNRNNCYNIPCRNYAFCQRDHGVEITVKIYSSAFNVPAALCDDDEVMDGILQGRINGGAYYKKDYKNY